MFPHSRFKSALVLASALVLLALAPASRAAAEGGGAGARGGGTGISCDERDPPVLLEEFQIGAGARVVALPEEREKIPRWLGDRLNDPELTAKILDAWNAAGSWDTWPLAGVRELETPVDFLIETLFQNPASVIATGHEPRSGLMHDDFFSVPAGCRRVQLAFLDGRGKTHRAYSGPISERTARFTELHEAIHSVGMRSYSHQTPHLTRRLVAALGTGIGVAPITGLFTSSARDASGFARAARVYFRKGAPYRPEGQAIVRSLRCPLAISLAYDGEDTFDLLVQEETEAGIKSTLVRTGSESFHRLRFPTGAGQNLLYYVDEENARLFVQDGEAGARCEYTRDLSRAIPAASIVSVSSVGGAKYLDFLKAWNAYWLDR